MSIGRISGPLLKANLLREGVDLAFETDLLYLDVNNMRIGVNTDTPTHDLQVNGTTRTIYLETDNLNVGDITISGNTVNSSTGVLNLAGFNGAAIVYQNKLKVDFVTIDGNIISTNAPNKNLEIRPNGDGSVEIYAETTVHGNLHATGNITADGNIQIGSSDQSGGNADTVAFNAEVASDIIPDANETYNLGSTDKRWNNVYTSTLYTDSVEVTDLAVDGVQLNRRQGKIYYVATNGNDTYSGTHQNDPYASLKKALTSATSGDTVFLYPGTYTEIFPLTVPVGVAVKGESLRSVTIQPTVGTVDKDAFLLNGETTVEDLTITGYRYNGTNNTGYAFRFANNFTVTNKSPYIRNITVISRGSVTSASDPYGFDSNDAGKGVLLDGSVANILSKEAACLFHAVTFFTPNQETLTATNGTRVEWLNCFSYFADKGMYLYSGATGFANAGKTALRLSGNTGTFNVGDTVSYYDIDGVTVLASGTIASKDLDGKLYLTGKVNGLITAEERGGKTIVAHGDAKLSTSVKKWGSASLALDGTGDYAYVQSNVDFAFGTGAWCVEAWVYNTATNGSNQIIFDFRTTDPQLVPTIYIDGATNHLHMSSSGSVRIDTGVALALNTWTHIAVAKNGTSTRFFVNGTQAGTTYTDNSNYIQGPLTIGSRYNYTNGFYGYIDDLRISKGTARYTSTFTAPISVLENDSFSVLLSRFDGTNNSTTFLDETVLLQDIRSSSSGTASKITLVDYSDFGVEVRAIGSATVYGNYGVEGVGLGVVAYLIGHNLAYIGVGKRSDNDTSFVIQDNEIVETSGAKIYYSSVDHKGDFRIGDLFYVNQQDGSIEFSNSNFFINSENGITFTNGGSTTFIDGTKIETGNLRLSGNTFESIVGPINVVSATDQVNFLNNVNISGDLDVTGNITIAGNIQVGDQATDTVNFVAGVDSDILPSITDQYNLGRGDLEWKYLYATAEDVGNVSIYDNIITTNAVNVDLVLSSDGGIVSVPTNDAEFGQNVTVNGTTTLLDTSITGTVAQTGDYTQTGNFTQNGNTDISGTLTVSGTGQFENILIDGNTISTTVPGTDLVLSGIVSIENFRIQGHTITNTVSGSITEITHTGTGYFKIGGTGGFVVPVGDTTTRPAVLEPGMMRFNTTDQRIETWTGTLWTGIAGANAGITAAEAEMQGITSAIIFG